tara:strand:- start:120 stop:548 length:429 start_codon:yes stop_codon:yes gene_type:complete
LDKKKQTKEKTMGLDQYGQLRNKKIDFEKVYSDKYEPTVHGFVWRKHSRLQTFMSDKFAELNPNADAMNGDDELVLTKEIIMELRKEVDNSFHNSFCSGGFFWGHQFQEEAVKEYSKQDSQFCDWALAQMERGETVVYTCSW